MKLTKLFVKSFLVACPRGPPSVITFRICPSTLNSSVAKDLIPLSIFVHFCQYLSIFVNICQYLSIFVNNCPYLSIFVNFCQYLSMFVNICPCLSIFVNICQYLSIFVNFCQYLSMFVNICPYLNICSGAATPLGLLPRSPRLPRRSLRPSSPLFSHSYSSQLLELLEYTFPVTPKVRHKGQTQAGPTRLLVSHILPKCMFSFQEIFAKRFNTGRGCR